MTLRFKRNLPLVMTLAALIALLVLALGDLPIVSYTAGTGAPGSASLASLSGVFLPWAALWSIQP